MTDNGSSMVIDPVVDEDWEEWDGKSPFWHHCVAGSLAGVTEHTLVYPLDTVRTHIQVCASCKFNPAAAAAASSSSGGASSAVATHSAKSALHHGIRTPGATMTRWATAGTSAAGGAASTGAASSSALPQGMWQTMRYLMSEPVALSATTTAATTTTTTTTTRTAAAAATTAAKNPTAGIFRLWRGVQTMVIGCIPAHALYFSSYEAVKAYWKNQRPNQELVWYGGMMAGAVATVSHDMIMAPLDTVKQRLQLGHYHGSVNVALRQMINKEGVIALYRSFPITLFANVPYGMIMVATNEALKQQWTTTTTSPPTLTTTLLASSMAGFVASACTTPLDRIKTSLQTQQLTPACWPTPPKECPQQARMSLQRTVAVGGGKSSAVTQPLVRNGYEAMTRILQQEGAIGLWRGMIPRVLSHTPAVAISWTTYETAKSILYSVTAGS